VAAWDVIVIGGGPAGLAAGHAAASAGATTLVLEKAEHPRYKTCGGGLIGPTLSAIPAGVDIPTRDHIDRVTFTRNGRREFTRAGDKDAGPIVGMVQREEFDLALCKAAISAGASVRQHAMVRAVEQHQDERRQDEVVVRLADGERLTAGVVVGADGSSGFTSRYVGVEYEQVDLGLELELPFTEALRRRWRGRLLIDWGPLPGSYGWVFPKGDGLTVGVIAGRGQGEQTKRYLREFVSRLGLSGIEPTHDSGHLTRCRTESSPLRRGQVLVAGDAAGLLEPWTREGISYALRSGTLAGAAAAAGDLDGYVSQITRALVPSMRAGRRLLRAFERHPGLFHTLLRTRPGWRTFANVCRGERTFDLVIDRRVVRLGLAVLG
jgi:geranylgeranyl reductase family protein